MIIPIELPSCILCKKEKPGDPEHIIPEILGGRLKSSILCNQCNHFLGSSIVSKLKDDPTLFYAVENLKEPGFHVAKSVKLHNLDNPPTLGAKTGDLNQYYMNLQPK